MNTVMSQTRLAEILFLLLSVIAVVVILWTIP